jgi:nicotinamidase-related amidase
MQNFFLSPSLGRSATGPGAQAKNALLKHAIPAARKAGIRVVWLNWGLTDVEIEEMPPTTLRAFGIKIEAALAEKIVVNGGIKGMFYQSINGKHAK